MDISLLGDCVYDMGVLNIRILTDHDFLTAWRSVLIQIVVLELLNIHEWDFILYWNWLFNWWGAVDIILLVLFVENIVFHVVEIEVFLIILRFQFLLYNNLLLLIYSSWVIFEVLLDLSVWRH